ncbi:hypothetical protein [Actinoplanes sp. NPDC051851]|uniref:hypothetical protein n=1 Tax=Actinoplanes sp. NPDC051851 TaxID=3154753 RepID=UPI00343AC5C8
MPRNTFNWLASFLGVVTFSVISICSIGSDRMQEPPRTSGGGTVFACMFGAGAVALAIFANLRYHSRPTATGPGAQPFVVRMRRAMEWLYMVAALAPVMCTVYLLFNPDWSL